MQRKINFLTSRVKKMRKAFAMILAISIIVILGGIMALSISMTAQTSSQTLDEYLYAQSELLARSATEYALLIISQNKKCQKNISFKQDDIYDINITIKYIVTSPSSCTDYITNITTPDQNGSVLLDVSVSTNKETNQKGTNPIRYFKRTIQKL